MKSKLQFLLLGAMLFMASVSCSASQPTDVGTNQHVSTIKQMATAQMPIELTITPYADAIVVTVVDELIPETFCNPVKPSPMVQLVCVSNPSQKVDGSAVLSWCIKDYNYKSLDRNQLSHYIEGIATEYQINS